MYNKLFATAALALATGVTAPAASAACGTPSCGTTGNTYNQTNTDNRSNAVSDSNATIGDVTGGTAKVENKVKSTVIGVGSPAIANVATRCGDVIRGTSWTLSLGAPVFGIGGGVGQTTREITMGELEKCIAKEYLLAPDVETRCLGLEAHREIFSAYRQDNPDAKPSALVTAFERRGICAGQPTAAVAVVPASAATSYVTNVVKAPQELVCPKGTHKVLNETTGRYECAPQ